MPIYLNELVSHASRLNEGEDEGCFGAIMDHFAAKDNPGNFVANKDLDTGEFIDTASARTLQTGNTS